MNFCWPWSLALFKRMLANLPHKHVEAACQVTPADCESKDDGEPAAQKARASSHGRPAKPKAEELPRTKRSRGRPLKGTELGSEALLKARRANRGEATVERSESCWI